MPEKTRYVPLRDATSLTRPQGDGRDRVGRSSVYVTRGTLARAYGDRPEAPPGLLQVKECLNMRWGARPRHGNFLSGYGRGDGPSWWGAGGLCGLAGLMRDLRHYASGCVADAGVR
jgi:hypothetical protein